MDDTVTFFNLVYDILSRYRKWLLAHDLKENYCDFTQLIKETLEYGLSDWGQMSFERKSHIRLGVREAVLQRLIGKGYPNLYNID